MIKKTKDYGMFKFLSQNREKIKQPDIDKIIESIKIKNILHLRPIIVNGNYEVLDGQHRLLAATALGVEVYYDKQDSLTSKDIIALSTAKAWGFPDYLNYYVQEGNEEYIKFKEFMNTYGLHIKVAISVIVGTTKEAYAKFKNGDFIFENYLSEETVRVCLEIREAIKMINGYCFFLDTARFWKACIEVTKSKGFQKKRLLRNISLLSQKVHAKATMKDYVDMLMYIHNYRTQVKINDHKILVEA